MELLGFVVVFGPVAFVLWLMFRSKEQFRDPKSLSDKESLSAIAGQADWLEKQLLHVAKFGGGEPQPAVAAKRREYIYQLCEALIARHPKPINTMYDATKRSYVLDKRRA